MTDESAEATAALSKMEAEQRVSPPSNPTTPQEARERMAALSENQEWRDRFFAKNAETMREYTDLTTLMAQADDRVQAVLDGKTEMAPYMELTNEDNPLTTRAVASAVEGLRAQGLSDETIKAQVFNRATVSAQEHRAMARARQLLLGNREWTNKLLAGDVDAKADLLLIETILNSDVA